MKSLHFARAAVAFASLAFAGSLSASAQSVEAIDQTSGSTLPGQGGTTDPDYSFFGPFNPGGGNGPQELTDFTEQDHGFNGANLPTISAPAGSYNGSTPITTVMAESVITGEQFFSESPVDLVDFTVKSTATSSYDLSLLFGIVDNGSNGEYIDGSFTVTLDDKNGKQLATDALTVTDDNTSSTTGLFANFALSGLATGDVIHVIGTPDQSDSNVQLPYVGAAGFTPTPEPSTYAMLFAGLGALAIAVRLRRLA
jgi:hypothetical protein